MSLSTEWTARAEDANDAVNPSATDLERDAFAEGIMSCVDDLDAACTAREAPPAAGDLAEPGIAFVAWFANRPGARVVLPVELQAGNWAGVFSRWQKFTLGPAGLMPCGWSGP